MEVSCDVSLDANEEEKTIKWVKTVYQSKRFFENRKSGMSGWNTDIWKNLKPFDATIPKKLKYITMYRNVSQIVA